MRVTFEGREYELRPGESVLDGMARHGVRLPSACRSGTCQACLLRAVSGDPGPAARRGLKPAWAASGYFLACLARPPADLVIAPPGGTARIPATVERVRRLAADVLSVRLRPGRPLRFEPGQHLTVTREGGVTRTYSIASLPTATGDIELHVRLYPGGAMSGWLAGARRGAAVTVGSPAGECFYVPGSPRAPLLLAGTGTGIAPLLAVARQALASGHQGPVAVLHGSATRPGLYLGTRCPAPLAAAARGRTVTWRTCVLEAGEDIVSAAVAELGVLAAGPASARAFLCGGPGVVRRLRRQLFLAGMPLAAIAADQFAAAAP